MSKPLVTIIIPAYNHEKYIEDCLKSVVEQTYSNMQIIALNDGSKDRTGILIEKFIKNTSNNHIEYINKKNEGLCKTLNSALQISKGQYIAIIASDDMWVKDKIEKQVDFLESNKNLGLVCADAYFIKNNKVLEKRYSEYKNNLKKQFKNSVQNANMYEELLKGNIILAVTVMIRKNCLDRVGLFDEDLKYEDYDMWLRIAKKYPIGYIDEPLAYYRMHEANISNNISFMFVGAIKTVFKQLKEYPLRNKPCKGIFLCVMFLFNILKNKLNKIFKVQRWKNE